jgi:hypothetical protein
MQADPHARRRLVVDVAGNVAAIAFFAAALTLGWSMAVGMSALRAQVAVGSLVVGLVLHLVAESARRPLP